MKASIVLRIKNEAKTLDAVLRGVKAQDYSGEVEIIVVDSGSTDDSLEIAKRHDCRIIEIKPEDFSWGYALNLGAEKSGGEVVVYLSGHCIPVDNFWLKNLMESFSNEQAWGAYSRHVPIPCVDPFEAVELIYLWFPPGDGTPVETKAFSNSASAIRKSAWKKIKFNEDILMGEDADWALKAARAGGKIYYQPRSMVYHSHPPKLETVYRRWFWRCYAAKTTLPKTREGHIPYLLYKTASYFLLDLRRLWRVNKLRHFWRIPFYETVRQLGGYYGARAAMKGKKYKKWNDIDIPGFMEKFRSVIENICK